MSSSMLRQAAMRTSRPIRSRDFRLARRWFRRSRSFYCPRSDLLRRNALVGIVHDVDLVGVTHAESLLIVDDPDVLTVMNVFHLVRGFAVTREDLIEFREDLEAQGLPGTRILDFDVVGRNVNR